MSPVKRKIYLLLLAVLGILSGVAIVVVALPIRNGNGKGGV